MGEGTGPARHHTSLGNPGKEDFVKAYEIRVQRIHEVPDTPTCSLKLSRQGYGTSRWFNR